jgi:hypothetical protein
MKVFNLLLLIIFYISFPANAEENENNVDKKRLTLITSANVAASAGTLLVLNQIWYKDYPGSSFQFHNDLPDWKQMDKLGHITSTYHFSKLSYRSFRWAGLNNASSAYMGTLSGTMLITTIEILDGFSSEWGFSLSDIGSNLLGAGTFLSQQIVWEKQKITWKYSWYPSGLENYRPDLLGNNLAENLIKDYNGHTFWLSGNLNLLVEKSSIPSWINLAIGHGATGMLGSRHNPLFHNDIALPQLNRTRSWYLAPDIDLSKINTGSDFLNQILTTLNFLKIPTPTLEYNTQTKWQWHWVFL